MVEYGGAALFDDAGLLLSNQRTGVAQLLGVLQADVGDHGCFGSGDHVCGIKASAQSHFQHDNIALHAQEKLQAQSGHQFKFRGGILHSLSGFDDQLTQLAQHRVGDGHAIHLKALMERPEIGERYKVRCAVPLA